MDSSSSLVELLNRCRAGDQQARNDLFHKYFNYLKVLARTQLGAPLRGKCDPSDVVQVTLMEAHRDFASFQGHTEAELLGWLRRILAHNLFNEARRFATVARDATREVSLDQVRQGLERSSVALAQQLPDPSPSPSEAAQRRESAVRVAEALSRLPEDYQEVLLLRIFEEQSAEEVALRMGRSPGAVRMLQLRALAALKELFKQD